MGKFVIDEGFLQQLARLQPLVKNNIAGLFGGNHKVRSFGSSCEFSDYRDYQAGDDIARIDWNAYARFEKLYMRLYLDERQMHTRIYIDASRSMAYGDGGKDEQALRLAAALAYVSVCETDKVSLYSVHGGELDCVINGMLGKEAFISGIGKLNGIEFFGDSRISEAIVPSKVGYGDGLSVIISDFLTDADYERAIDTLVGKRRDVLCIQVLSRDELNPQIRGKSHLFDSEDTQVSYKKNITRDVINAYRAALDEITGRIRKYCAARGAGYILVPADASLYEVMFGKLSSMGVVK